MTLNKEGPGVVTLLQGVIFLQFGTAFFITVMTTVGISFGYAVSAFFLMALLQVLVAIPGVVHIAMQGNVWIAVYVAFQSVTAICELYWLIVMIMDDQPAGRWIALLLLTSINVAAVVIALWFRQKQLPMTCKKTGQIEKNKPEKQEKPKMEAPSMSMSEMEKSKAIKSSKSSPVSSLSSKSSKQKPKEKRNDENSVSDKSSKGKNKIRKPKKSTSKPLDSRETSSASHSIKSAQSTDIAFEYNSSNDF